jgi:hypothetical protein
MMMLNIEHTPAVIALAEFVDAARCLEIVTAPEAAHDPVALWGMVPLGLPPKETLAAVARLPRSPDPDRLATMIDLARDRYGFAIEAARKHFTVKELPEDVITH